MDIFTINLMYEILTIKFLELLFWQRMNERLWEIFHCSFVTNRFLGEYRRPDYGILTKMHLKEFDETESLRQILELPQFVYVSLLVSNCEVSYVWCFPYNILEACFILNNNYYI